MEGDGGRRREPGGRMGRKSGRVEWAETVGRGESALR